MNEEGQEGKQISRRTLFKIGGAIIGAGLIGNAVLSDGNPAQPEDTPTTPEVDHVDNLYSEISKSIEQGEESFYKEMTPEEFFELLGSLSEQIINKNVKDNPLVSIDLKQSSGLIEPRDPTTDIPVEFIAPQQTLQMNLPKTNLDINIQERFIVDNDSGRIFINEIDVDFDKNKLKSLLDKAGHVIPIPSSEDIQNIIHQELVKEDNGVWDGSINKGVLELMNSQLTQAGVAAGQLPQHLSFAVINREANPDLVILELQQNKPDPSTAFLVSSTNDNAEPIWIHYQTGRQITKE